MSWIGSNLLLDGTITGKIEHQIEHKQNTSQQTGLKCQNKMKGKFWNVHLGKLPSQLAMLVIIGAYTHSDHWNQSKKSSFFSSARSEILKNLFKSKIKNLYTRLVFMPWISVF